ncbi:MAG: hypothetical protein ACLQOO_01290 [Terriglobia bacterium]
MKTSVTKNGTNKGLTFVMDATNMTIPTGVTDSGYRIAVEGAAYTNTAGFAGTLGAQYGVWGRAGINAATSGAKVSNAYAGYFDILNSVAGTTITNAYGVYILNSATTGTITNRYDLFASSANAKSYFAGNVGIGTMTPAANLEVAGNVKVSGGGHGITYPDGSTQATAALPGSGTVTSVGSGVGLTGGPITGSGTLSIANGGVTNPMLANPWLTLTAGTDLTGGGPVALGSSVTLNLDTTKVPRLSVGNTFTVNQNFQGNGNTAQIGDMGCGSGFAGLSLFGAALACTNYAMMGDLAGNLYVNRPLGGSLYFREGNGTELTIQSGGNVSTTANLFTNNIFAGSVTGSSFAGDGSKLTFAGNGESAVIGNLGCNANSAGVSFQGAACANFALLDFNGQTILNRKSGQKLSFREGNGADQMTVLSGGGVNINGGFTVNSGPSPVSVLGNGKSSNYAALATFAVLDYTKDNSTEMFLAWAPNAGESNCYIDTSANFNCTGPSSTLASVDDGSRQVTLYATQSAENWFDDYGAGTLVNGVATVTLDPVFAQTINTAVGYRVFVTPSGDCHGLYVTNKTATSFEVHELGGGHANIDFDYRIVGKRKGYENVRLADQTERFNRMKAQHDSEATATTSTEKQ